MSQKNFEKMAIVQQEMLNNSHHKNAQIDEALSCLEKRQEKQAKAMDDFEAFLNGIDVDDIDGSLERVEAFQPYVASTDDVPSHIERLDILDSVVKL
ncbi:MULTISPECIES: hypothetical protein [unclassified Desulfovibrio]|uniref:hypothetical protein n=1 Tax=unclassified Desulfovibrio TaxID=2593640 RepID=UPI000FB86B8B|nr:MULTISPECIES: hypothetical protein [unclassified Desulfovibrio]RRD68767.1 hypothetical protein EII24_12180 [Desulfovibrio sp. OH1209_COT-279]RRD81231.1 hypothetical protein EII23_12180 [Desulfovibrio sp. OH1186_COT-070]